MGTKKSERAVVVCTTWRGVFFGYAKDTSGDPITLSRARMCVYWSADVRGVMGLAATGPTTGCKVSQAAPSIELRGITGVMECSPEAAEKWERGPWA